MEMDLPRTQLSLLVGYGNPHSAAVPRTLAGRRRHKTLLAAAQEGTAPWEPLLQVLNQFSSFLLGSWVQALSRLILLHIKTRFAIFTQWTVQLLSYQYIFLPQ